MVKPCVRQLDAYVLSGLDLPSADIFSGFSDPYVSIRVIGKESTMDTAKTTVKKRTLNPLWMEHHVLKVTPDARLECTVYDWNRIGKPDFLGRCVVPVYDIKETKPIYYLLQNQKGSLGRGSIRIGWKFVERPPPSWNEKIEQEKKELSDSWVLIEEDGEEKESEKEVEEDLDREREQAAMPPNWEVRWTSWGRPYYVNHETHTTHPEAPSPSPSTSAEDGEQESTIHRREQEREMATRQRWEHVTSTIRKAQRVDVAVAYALQQGSGDVEAASQAIPQAIEQTRREVRQKRRRRRWASQGKEHLHALQSASSDDGLLQRRRQRWRTRMGGSMSEVAQPEKEEDQLKPLPSRIHRQRSSERLPSVQDGLDSSAPYRRRTSSPQVPRPRSFSAGGTKIVVERARRATSPRPRSPSPLVRTQSSPSRTPSPTIHPPSLHRGASLEPLPSPHSRSRSPSRSHSRSRSSETGEWEYMSASSTESSGEEEEEVPLQAPPQRVPFPVRVSRFRERLRGHAGHCRVLVHRKNLLESSYRAVIRLKRSQLRQRLRVRFIGEEGIDFGGVAREWFNLTSKEVFSPYYALFEYSPNHTLKVNPGSNVNDEHLDFFRFCGRLLGMAVFTGNLVPSIFVPTVYKWILGTELTVDDVAFVGPSFVRSLKSIEDNDITGWGLYFCVDDQRYGRTVTHDLKPHGRDVEVTQENKNEYIRLLLDFKLRNGIQEQMDALAKGFHEVIPQTEITEFSPAELELLLSGVQEIDPTDWRKHTECVQLAVREKCTQLVSEMNAEARSRLLQFCTGSSVVPVGGFGDLSGGEDGLRCLFRITKAPGASTGHLPTAHTCFNTLDLPGYTSKTVLREKLLMAVGGTEGFGVA